MVTTNQEKAISYKSAQLKEDIHPILYQRWSPRIFADKPITDQHLRQLFEALRWAPSSMNEQPWRILYTRNGSDIFNEIFNCLSEFNQSWVKNASVLLLTAYKEKFDNGKENFHALHDLGLGIANLTFQAQHHLIAVHQMAGVDWQKAHEVFQIPEGYHVTTAVALGYYGGELSALPNDLIEKETAKRKRKAMEEIVLEDKFPI